MLGVDDRTAIAWLHRRVGLGLAPGELDGLVPLGVDAVVERLLAPGANGVDEQPDPWTPLGLTYDRDNARDQAKAAIAVWIPAMATTPRPTESWLTWFWHGHFATSIAKVRFASLMVEQIRLFQHMGAGPFADLLRAVTTDPAMLVWLDGRENTRNTPNENFGREVMELFSLGIGSYTEDDVAAAAGALSGWKLQRTEPVTAMLVANRHDDRPRTYLGNTGVQDVDGVIDAITAQPECSRFVAGRLADAVLGEAADDGLISDLAATFRAADLDLGVLLRAVVEAGLARLDGRPEDLPPVVVAPVPWLVAGLRATRSRPKDKVLAAELKAAGQVPMAPPNVGGWPGGAAWLGSSTTLARFNLAVAVAQATGADAPVRRAAAEGPDDELADLLGRPEGFGPATLAAVDDARRSGGPPGVAPLTVALASPDLVVA